MSSSAEMLHHLGGLKWTYYDDDVLGAWVAEMDFGLAPPIADALHRAVDLGLTGYPYPEAEEAAATAAIRFWADRFDWSVDPSWVYPAPDVIEGIRRCIVHLTRPDSPVILHTPVYFPFFSMVEGAGRDMIEVACRHDERGRYSLDIEGIERGFEAGAGSIVVCNPWNPTGRVLDRTELEEVLAVAERHDARVIADEIHALITYDDVEHNPISTLDPDRAVTVTAASKAWNLPGLKCAQIVLTNESDRVTWERHFTPEKVGVGTFGLFAAEAAYSEGGVWFDGILDQLQSNRDLLTNLVSEHAASAVFTPPEGTYLAWLDLSAYGLENPTRYLLEHARVALTDGGPFGGKSSQFARLNFATHAGILVEMMERIGKTLQAV